MHVYRIYFLIILLIPCFVQGNNNLIVIDNFENIGTNIFDEWQIRDGSVDNATKIYKLNTEDNNKFLSASSNSDSIQIAKKVTWDIKEYPHISWKWRVKALPNDANESARGKNDSAASLYVIFQRENIPFLSWKYQPINVIKYIWSASLPDGHVVTKEKEKYGKKIYVGKFIVIKTGTNNLDQWHNEKRNVLEDYKKVFGKAPKFNPYLIGILTDSNDTGSSAAADYDDIVISK